MTRIARHKTLHEFVAASGAPKWQIAQRLGVSRFKLAGLLYPDRYPVALNDELVERLAELLNQTPDYIRKFYERAAAGASLPKASGL